MNHGRPWTAEEDARLLAGAGQPYRQLARELGRSESSVRGRLSHLRQRGA